MTIAAGVAIFAAALGLVAAALTLGFSTAPGWSDKRWFALVCVWVAVYCGINAIFTLPGYSVAANVLASRVQMASAFAFGISLLIYTARRLGNKLTVMDQTLIFMSCVAAILALTPGGLFKDMIGHHEVPSLGLTYVIVEPATFGPALMAIVPASVLVALAHFVAAIRAGAKGLVAPCIGLACSTVITVFDVLTSAQLIPFPYLADVGFLLFVSFVGVETTQRFVANAMALADLTERLEMRVKQRTDELGSTQRALLRAEKLAAIGQLSAGVAHEINNPAAAIEANLRHIERTLEERRAFPADARECIDESLMGVRRIERIVKQLLDAGRTAAQMRGEEYKLREAIESAARMTRHALQRDVNLAIRVRDDLLVMGDKQLLEQVFMSLLTNAFQAIPVEKDGHIAIEAQEEADLVQIVVRDDGIGMSEETMKRAFDPFYTTRPANEGMGLGLSVSLGLVHAVNGDLWLESASGKGTRVHVMLRKRRRVARTA